MEKFSHPKTIKIKDLATLKTIADPLRNQIFESLSLRPLTVKQVAENLGLSPKRLYYHIKLLEKHGLIQVVETRVVSNIIEKVYHATAPSLEVDPSLCVFAPDEGPENLNTINTAVIDMTRDDLARSLQARAVQLAEGAEKHPRQLIVSRELSRMDETRAREFQARLRALLQEFEDHNVDEASQEGDLQTYALTVVFYPHFYYPEEEKTSVE